MSGQLMQLQIDSGKRKASSKLVGANESSELVNRDSERAAFDFVTRQLIEADASGNRDSAFFTALHKNRDLWAACHREVSSEKNKLPEPLKELFKSVAEWVEDHTVRVICGQRDASALIVVNRNIVDGLA
jgi:flagellar protein FlaF